MADSKISALPAASTPLAGTELVPVVQGGITEQVSVANLTAGRSVSAASLSLTTTPLAVTSGGTGTATAFTAGSVVFAGASGVYSQNNANFFWDNTNIRLGLNNSAPTATLEVGTTASTGRYIQVNGSSADSSYLVFKGSKQYPRIDLEDTASGGSTFQVWNLGNQLRIGTDASTQGNAAFYVAAGNAANVTFNGDLIAGKTAYTTKGTVSCTSGVATTMFTIPSNVAFFAKLDVWISSSSYVGTVTVAQSGAAGATPVIIGASYYGGISFSMSGQNVQVTQTSGSTLTANWSYIRNVGS